MNRGDHLEPIVLDERDRQSFMRTLGEAAQSAGWVLHSFVLMPNHYHLLVETPRPTLIKGMQWLNATYTQRYNGRHKTRGHLFQGRYKALLVDESSPGYLVTVSDYIHLNPLRAKLVGSLAELLCYRWSSVGWLSGRQPKCPPWLRWERVYGELGLRAWNAKTQEAYRSYLSQRVAEAARQDWSPIRRGWCYGSEGFAQAMKQRLAALRPEQQRQETWSGAAVEELEQERAARVLVLGAAKLGYDDVRSVPGRQRYLLAKLARAETKVSLNWLAPQLGVATRGGLSSGIYEVSQQLTADTRLRKAWKKLAMVKL
jgi:REP element-mobilizing transposase RayT